MDLSKMRDRELVETFAALAVKIDETDLDLVSSGKRLSSAMSGIRKIIFKRMNNGKSQANKILLQTVAVSAIKANSNGLASSRLHCIDLIDQVVAEMPETQNERQIEVA